MKENISVFSNNFVNLMTDITPLFGKALHIRRSYMR